MWMTIYDALSETERAEIDADAPPVHCPHPSDCLRFPMKESRSFGRGGATPRSLLLARYRRMISEQCACNRDHSADVKI